MRRSLRSLSTIASVRLARPAVALSCRSIPFTTRSFGVMANLQSKIADSQAQAVEVKKSEEFAKFLSHMLSISKFTLNDFKHLNEDIIKTAGGNDWRSKLPFFGQDKAQQAQVATTKKMLEILTFLNPQEMADRKLVDSSTRTRLAKDAKVPINEVNQVVKQYDMSVLMHKWLKERQANKLPLPSSQDEMLTLFQTQPGRGVQKQLMRQAGQRRR